MGSDPEAAPLEDFLMHGYEERLDFLRAVRRLTDRWHDRVGEAIDERNGFLLLRFHDTPGGRPDEAWLPLYLLTDAGVMPEEPPRDELEDEITEAFGFD